MYCTLSLRLWLWLYRHNRRGGWTVHGHEWVYCMLYAQ